MANMQVDLFRALKSIWIPDEAAQKVVENVEGYIAVKIEEATKPLLTKMESLSKDISALRWYIAGLATVSIMAASVGGYVAIVMK